MPITIETDRLILREIEDYDLQGVFELYSQPEVHMYLGEELVKSMKEAESIIDYIRNQYKQNGIGRWAVIEKETNDFIGWSGLKIEDEVREEMDYYDLGYRFKKEYWGKGIATETALVSLKFGFQEMNLTNIYAGAHVDNIGSNKVLKKVGLKFIEKFEYESMPHNWYGITKQEWQEKNDM